MFSERTLPIIITALIWNTIAFIAIFVLSAASVIATRTV
jgi:hypothetical protein